MENFVNQIKTKDGSLYDIQDKRVDGIKAAEGKLHVEKVEMPVGPVPVATIDGVKYYHKCEFDLEDITKEGGYNLLTGETSSESQSSVPLMHYNHAGGPSEPMDNVNFTSPGLHDGRFPVLNMYYLWRANGEPDYTSRVFIVVHSIEDVDSGEDKICLPENVTAYYGFLSEDGKTFISYWNEGEVDVDTSVSKISDGSNEVEVHDARLIVTAADTGKVVTVDENGNLVLAQPSGSGTKLYLHELILTTSNGNELVKVINDSANEYILITGGPQRLHCEDAKCLVSEGYYILNMYNADIVLINNVKVDILTPSLTKIDFTGITSDTVTEL